MHGRVSPPGTQDRPVTADRAGSAVSHAGVKQSEANPNGSAAQAEKSELYTRVTILSFLPAFTALRSSGRIKQIFAYGLSSMATFTVTFPLYRTLLSRRSSVFDLEAGRLVGEDSPTPSLLIACPPCRERSRCRISETVCDTPSLQLEKCTWKIKERFQSMGLNTTPPAPLWDSHRFNG